MVPRQTPVSASCTLASLLNDPATKRAPPADIGTIAHTLPRSARPRLAMPPPPSLLLPLPVSLLYTHSLTFCTAAPLALPRGEAGGEARRGEARGESCGARSGYARGGSSEHQPARERKINSESGT
jgi:hypothetical protein